MNINLTLIGQMIAFVLFVGFCMKYVWPHIIAAMKARAELIADGLAAADRAGHDLEIAKGKAAERMAEAKAEAAVIVDSANKRGTQIVVEAKSQAIVEADRVKASAQAEIEQEMNRAKEQLRSQVASLALAGAAQVLEASIDEDVHSEIVDKLAAEL